MGIALYFWLSPITLHSFSSLIQTPGLHTPNPGVQGIGFYSASHSLPGHSHNASSILYPPEFMLLYFSAFLLFLETYAISEVQRARKFSCSCIKRFSKTQSSAVTGQW